MPLVLASGCRNWGIEIGNHFLVVFPSSTSHKGIQILAAQVQSAQFTLQGSKVLSDGTRQTPKTSLVYALPQGVHNLTPSFALTFMHEIGHAVHSLLSETHFQHLSGTRGTIDFVEPRV